MKHLINGILIRIAKYAPFTHKQKWHIGMQDEVMFWDRYIASHYALVNGVAASEEGRVRSDPNTPLQDVYRALVAHCEGPVIKVLDVGSGPFTRLGKTLPGKQLEVTAVDPLADTYVALCRKHGAVPPVPPIRGEGEHLSSMFPRDHFDMAHANNCLNHAYDPIKAIEELVKVVKPGCSIYLRHGVNEAINADYVGLHQWNFHQRDGAMLITDKQTTVNMNERFAGRATIDTHLEGRFMVNVIRKNGAATQPS
jgi:SAM-dependent methyltransferase